MPSRAKESAIRLPIEIPNNPGSALLLRLYATRQLELYLSQTTRRCHNAGEENYFTRVRAYDRNCRKFKVSKIETQARPDTRMDHCGIGLKAQGWKKVPCRNCEFVHLADFCQ
jgi:hypothetical protein